jgi:hypothetical protein
VLQYPGASRHCITFQKFTGCLHRVAHDMLGGFFKIFSQPGMDFSEKIVC